jgi:hypothetical protein
MYDDSIEGLAPRKKIRVRNYPEKSNDTFQLETKISSIEGRYKTAKKFQKIILKRSKIMVILMINMVFVSLY